MSDLTLHLEILPAPQRRVWSELSQIPQDFVLYGGTAIALQLGHRQSIDFDFFAFRPIDPQHLLGTVPFLVGAQVLQMEPNTLTVLVDRGGPVQVSFFGTPKLGQISEPHKVASDGVSVAALIDLAGTKAAVVQRRAEAKDYIDIDALIARAGITLSNALASAALIYGRQFTPQLTLKALSYFGEGDLDTVPRSVKTRLLDAVSKTDLDDLPELDAIRSHGESGA
ncbi:MAG: nucleotidyl transferase AbiEii/AbiGii toxin family protein [Ahrensia sp.]|nr:nucleotidyl transferase AbiEii/AbiGii toxin family protein [Ahrensia sp.]